ncbi:unnamed protein product [Mycena citricolor]|uniref:Uncharacterized protein n=1 Tax=Mycena citricolor TaxID=2018698 RepID=A0AAD2GWR1_9AGAR|nr:unnamed protein product [Mycena citricolor]
MNISLTAVLNPARPIRCRVIYRRKGIFSVRFLAIIPLPCAPQLCSSAPMGAVWRGVLDRPSDMSFRPTLRIPKYIPLAVRSLTRHALRSMWWNWLDRPNDLQCRIDLRHD